MTHFDINTLRATATAVGRIALAGAILAAFIAAPVGLSVVNDKVVILKSSVQAKDGGSDNSGSGSDDSDDSDDDSSGRGGSDDNSSRSGRRGSDDNSSRSGRRGGDDSVDDNSTGRRGRGADDIGGVSLGRRGSEHIDPSTGSKIEVSGSSIEVVHSNGWKEELENGVYEVKDPAGRTVTERRATAEDIARMQAFAR